MKRLWIASLLLLAGCGPFVSGTWSDDPKNWKRAFGESRPSDGVAVVHSWYMRTPHFTAEFAWFFEVDLSERAKKEVLSSSDLSKLSLTTLDALRSRTYRDWPVWFKPELSAYDIYESKSDQDFIILVAKQGGHAFWTRYQL